MATLTAAMRRGLERVLRHRGYELKLCGAPPRRFDDFFAFVKRRGFAPGTVFDVGVGRGTRYLYRAFPDARFVLFEPLDRFEPYLKDICSRYDAEYHLCALGDRDGERPFHVSVNFPTESSLQPRTEGLQGRTEGKPNAKVEATVVSVRTLDGFSDFPPPYLLKLDVEGAELGVLRGAVGKLRDTEMALIEIGVMPRTVGQADMAAVAGFMKAHGFALYDIVDMAQSRPGGPLSYLDAAFVREDSPLRAWEAR